MAIGVIVSGKLLAQKLRLDAGTGQLFRIPVKGVFTIEATGGEVVLGVSFYLICLLFLGMAFGSGLQPWVKLHFGIDPGQFNCLGFVSSLTAVTISSAVFLFAKIQLPTTDRTAVQRRDRVVEELTKMKLGDDATLPPEVKP